MRILIVNTYISAEWIIFFKKRILFEWFRDRWKEQANTEIFQQQESICPSQTDCLYILPCSFFTILWPRVYTVWKKALSMERF